MSWFLFSLLACSAPPPTTVADCPPDVGPARAQCLVEVLPPLFKTQPEEALQIAEREISDPLQRDFLYLKVTRDVDPSTPRYCDKIQDEKIRERCRVLVSRPHLHRDKLPPPPRGGQ